MQPRTEIPRQGLQLRGVHTITNIDLIPRRTLASAGPSYQTLLWRITWRKNPDPLDKSQWPRMMSMSSTEDTDPRSKKDSNSEEKTKDSKTESLEIAEDLIDSSAKIAQNRDSDACHVFDSSRSHVQQGEDDSCLRNDSALSHVDCEGKASMVGVGAKRDSIRTAEAEGRIIIGRTATTLVAQNGMKKGDVLTVAQLAGVMGAKATSSLIPLCHPLLITNITVDLTLDVEQAAVVVRSR